MKDKKEKKTVKEEKDQSNLIKILSTASYIEELEMDGVKIKGFTGSRHDPPKKKVKEAQIQKKHKDLVDDITQESYDMLEELEADPLKIQESELSRLRNKELDEKIIESVREQRNAGLRGQKL